MSSPERDMNQFILPTDAGNPFADIVCVLGVTGVAQAISLTDVEHAMSILSLAVATAYVLWKWYRDIQKIKRHAKTEQNSTPHPDSGDSAA